jgi:hypothetical protein
VDKEERKRAKRAYKESEKARSRDLLVLGEAELRDLLNFLDEEEQAGATCDHTLRLTMVWASERGVDPDALEESLNELGGGCDCEVLANVVPEELF